MQEQHSLCLEPVSGTPNHDLGPLALPVGVPVPAQCLPWEREAKHPFLVVSVGPLGCVLPL